MTGARGKEPEGRTWSRFFLGLDLGQAADPTALAVLERQMPIRRLAHAILPPEPLDPAGCATFQCRHLERLTLGTPYPAVVDHVARVLATPALKGRTELVVDATGVGKPVVDHLRQRGLACTAITITGGDQVTSEPGGWRVPKRDLVGAVQVLLQTERLKFAAEIPAVPALVQELLAFRVKIDPLTAHDSYGSWREGSHDDMVLAVAVAAWYGQRWRQHASFSTSRSYANL